MRSRTWRSASGNFDTRCGYLISVEDNAGRRGYGDCAPLAGTESGAQAKDWLREQRAGLTGLQTDAALAGLGAFGRGAHSPDETVELDLLPLVIKRTALLVYRLTR